MIDITLDNLVSQAVKERDLIDGKGYCISCGAPITRETCENGHFIPRANEATRYDTYNCNCQCFSCNRSPGGNPKGYEQGLIKKYGEWIIPHLRQLGHSTAKFSKSDKLEMRAQFRRMIKELKQSRK